MYKQHLLESLEREIKLLKQLAPFIEEGDLEFRPAEKLRSTYELMQYLSGIGATMMRWFILNDLNQEEWIKIREYRKTLSLQNFVERLDEQSEQIKSYFDKFSEEELSTKEIEMPNKEKMLLGPAILNGPLKWLAAYRMELFIYLKMNGKSQLSTKEAWSILQAV